MMDEMDGLVLAGGLVVLAVAVVILDRRYGVLRRDVDFLRIVVTEVDAAKAD